MSFAPKQIVLPRARRSIGGLIAQNKERAFVSATTKRSKPSFPFLFIEGYSISTAKIRLIRHTAAPRLPDVGQL